MTFSKTVLRSAIAACTLFSFSIGLISFIPVSASAQIRRERPPTRETTETLTGDKAVESLKNSGAYDGLKDAFQKATGAKTSGGTGAESLLPNGSYEEVGITASDGAVNDYFGLKVSVSGDTALVGAINNNSSTGAAYVFVRSGSAWTQQAKLTASDGVIGDDFGCGVAVSGDIAVIGAFRAGPSGQGAAYIFTRSGTVWTQEQKLTAPDATARDYFGNTVAISGETALVGAYYDDVGSNMDQGSAYVFTRSGTTWTAQQKLTASDGTPVDYFANSASISGDTAVIGASLKWVNGNSAQGAAYVFTRTGTTWTQQQILTASDGAASTYFADGVAVSGDTAVVGAVFGGPNASGAAYIFSRSGTTWTQQQKLTASDGNIDDRFGFSVAISGETAVIGAYGKIVGGNRNQGAVYVFSHSGATWTQQDELTASDGSSGDNFAFSVSVSGETIIAGAYFDKVGSQTNQGSAKIFQTKMSIAKNGASDGNQFDAFGASVALSGDTAVVSATGPNSNRGAVYVFTRSGATWTLQQKLTASDGAEFDLFGQSVSLSGDTMVVGANCVNSQTGAAYVFTRSGVTWTQQAKLTAADSATGDYFGTSVSVSGDTAVVGAYAHNSSTGAAYVFTRSGSTWTQQQKLIASDGTSGDELGSTVSLSGDTTVVGAHSYNSNTGAAYVFVRSGTTWTQQQKLTATDGVATDNFGHSVAVSGDTAVVTANATGSYRGAAYVFVRSGTTWTEAQKLTAPDAAPYYFFGQSVSLSGDTILVGSPEWSGGQGAAYMFTRSGSVWSFKRQLIAPDGVTGEYFGWSVAVSTNTALVGALYASNVPPGFNLVQTGGNEGSSYMYYWGPTSPTAAGSRLSGRVLGADGRGLRNAMVVVTDSSGVQRAVQTGTFGNFTFNDLPSGDTYVLSVRSRLYQFVPQAIYVGADLDGLRMQPATGSRR